MSYALTWNRSNIEKVLIGCTYESLNSTKVNIDNMIDTIKMK